MKETKLYIKLAYLYREIKWKLKKYNTQNISLKDNNKNKAYVFISADYGNLGDIAITYAQKLFLKEQLKNYEIVEVPSKETYAYIKIIKRIIKPNDIITLIGGGNMSNKYDGIEESRRMVIKEFESNRIISFPQTIEFDDSNYGKVSLKRTKKIYKHNNLILFAREKMSFETMKKIFKDKEIYLTPDIAMYLKGKIIKEDTTRKGIGICFRKDCEKSIDDSLKNQILEMVENDEKEYFDTYIGSDKFVYDTRYDDLMNFIKKIASKELVITDRLHGMIFCYITNTPCLVIDNANHKIKSTYNTWLRGCSYIKLVDNKISMKDISELKNTNVDINLEEKFDILKKVINKWL